MNEGFLLALAIDTIFFLIFIFNPKFAWSNPGEVPPWVQKRIRTLSEDQRQEIRTLEKIGSKLNASGVFN